VNLRREGGREGVSGFIRVMDTFELVPTNVFSKMPVSIVSFGEHPHWIGTGREIKGVLSDFGALLEQFRSNPGPFWPNLLHIGALLPLPGPPGLPSGSPLASLKLHQTTSATGVAPGSDLGGTQPLGWEPLAATWTQLGATWTQLGAPEGGRGVREVGYQYVWGAGLPKAPGPLSHLWSLKYDAKLFEKL
jgi:hypothetical protein